MGREMGRVDGDEVGLQCNRLGGVSVVGGWQKFI